MNKPKNDKKRRSWLPDKNEIIKAISNQCPHCGNRNNNHLQTTIETKQGELKVRVCTVCRRKYQKIGEN